jgi:hypothetical protein
LATVKSQILINNSVGYKSLFGRFLTKLGAFLKRLVTLASSRKGNRTTAFCRSHQNKRNFIFCFVCILNRKTFYETRCRVWKEHQPWKFNDYIQT